MRPRRCESWNNYVDIVKWLQLLQDGPSYIRVFVSILRDIFKEETVEYVLALIDEMLTGKEATELHVIVSYFCYLQ